MFFSSNSNPIYNLLELLWTRISYKLNISSQSFGFDSDLEAGKLFLKGRVIIKSNKSGWEYSSFDYSKKELESFNIQKVPWKPHSLNEKEFNILVLLSQNNELSINDESLSLEIINSLVEKELVFIEDQKMRFLTKSCKFAIFKDGTYCAGENIDSQFDKWMNSYLNKASH
jgi:hypothetical protein